MRVLLILISLLLVGCATTPSRTIVFTPLLESSEWQSKTIDDPFDGKVTTRYVVSEDGQGKISFQQRGGKISFRYNNGDNYVCARSSGGIDLDMIADGERFNLTAWVTQGNSDMGIDYQNGSSFLDPMEAQFVPLLYFLAQKNTLIVRTIDSCGTQITKRFDITGNIGGSVY